MPLPLTQQPTLSNTRMSSPFKPIKAEDNVTVEFLGQIWNVTMHAMVITKINKFTRSEEGLVLLECKGQIRFMTTSAYYKWVDIKKKGVVR